MVELFLVELGEHPLSEGLCECCQVDLREPTYSLTELNGCYGGRSADQMIYQISGRSAGLKRLIEF